MNIVYEYCSRTVLTNLLFFLTEKQLFKNCLEVLTWLILKQACNQLSFQVTVAAVVVLTTRTKGKQNKEKQ